MGLGRPGPRADACPTGRNGSAYGGDFGDLPNDGAFCLNGLVPTRPEPHPPLLELAAVIQPVGITWTDPKRGRATVTNRNFFVDLSNLTATWELTVDGLVARERHTRTRRTSRPASRRCSPSPRR